MLKDLSKRQIWLSGLMLGLTLGSMFILTLWATSDNGKEIKNCDKPHVDEWTPARSPETGADSSLIMQINFFVDENIRLERYIKFLEEDNQRLGSFLAETNFMIEDRD